VNEHSGRFTHQFDDVSWDVPGNYTTGQGLFNKRPMEAEPFTSEIILLYYKDLCKVVPKS
jgi:hypothetical protein